MKQGQLQLLALVFIASLGLVDALYLTTLKLEAEVTGATRSQLCEAISESGCEIALSSDMSTIGPVPISLIGAITYLLIIALVFRMLFEPKRAFEGAAIQLIGLGALLASIGLAGYSWSQDSWCVLCIGLYVVNLAIYGLIARYNNRGWFQGIASSLTILRTEGRAFVITCLIFAGALAVSQMGYSKLVVAQTGTMSERAQKLLNDARAHGLVTVAPMSAPRLGPADTKTSITKFSDFECPFCKRFWQNIEAFHKSRDDVRISFRHYPLSSECNPFMGSPFHAQACQAAYAAACADRHGKFWEMGSALYANQPDFSELSLIRMASSIGLEPGSFKACLKDPAIRQSIIDDVLVGRSVGISGTPGSIIGGLRFEGALPVNMLTELMDTIANPNTKTPAPNTLVNSLEDKRGRSHPEVAPGPHGLTPPDGTLPAVVGFVDPADPRAESLLRTLVQLTRQTAGMFPISIRLLTQTPDASAISCAIHLEDGPRILTRWAAKKLPSGTAFIEAVSQIEPDGKVCLTAPETAQRLKTDKNAADALGIQERAALFVGNIPLNPSLDTVQIEQAVAWQAVQIRQSNPTKDGPK